MFQMVQSNAAALPRARAAMACLSAGVPKIGNMERQAGPGPTVICTVSQVREANEAGTLPTALSRLRGDDMAAAETH